MSPTSYQTAPPPNYAADIATFLALARQRHTLMARKSLILLDVERTARYSTCSRRCACIAGWSSLVARRAHNPKVVGSNPAPATIRILKPAIGGFFVSNQRWLGRPPDKPPTLHFRRKTPLYAPNPKFSNRCSLSSRPL